MKQREIFTSLKDKRQIERLFKTGMSLNTKNLLIKYLIEPVHSETTKSTLFALWAIPKKVNNAVGRNQLKRHMRHALFLAGKEMAYIPTENNYYIAFIPRLRFANLPETERVNEMNSILRSIQNRAL